MNIITVNFISFVFNLIHTILDSLNKFKLSKNAMNKIKPLLQQRKRELNLSQNIDPVERAAAQNKVQQIETQIDQIIRDDQS